MPQIELSYLDQELNFPEILQQVPEQDLVILFRKIPKNADQNHSNSWWTPSGIRATNYGGIKDGELLITVIPTSILNILIKQQLIEKISQELDEDDDHFFPQYFFHKPIKSFRRVSQETINLMTKEYYRLIAQIVHPDQAMQKALEVSKKVGITFLRRSSQQ